MNIRLANKFDLPHVLRMLRHFRDNTPLDCMRECDDEQWINSLFHQIIIGGGVALIAENEEPIGMILGVFEHNIWDPKSLLLRELVYWVEPEYRGTTAGYRLLKKYNEIANDLKEQNKIKLYTMTKMVNSPDLDFARFGYQKTEEVWVAGA